MKVFFYQPSGFFLSMAISEEFLSEQIAKNLIEIILKGDSAPFSDIITIHLRSF